MEARPKQVRRRMQVSKREALWGYLFVAPWLLGLVAFTAWPIIRMIYNSFTRYNLLSPAQWIGMANYVEMLTDDDLFWRALGNTCFYVAFAVPLHLGGGFIAALLLNRKIFGMRFYRLALYLPSITPFVAMAAIWRFTLSRDGLMNYALQQIGIPPQGWFTSLTLVKPAIVLLSLWFIGSSMIIFLAGLQSIPRSLYESAEIDGANSWAQMRFITLPMMTPSILFNLVLGVIGSFQVFSHGYILTQGGPANASLFYVHYIYRRAFQSMAMGYASALTVVLFLVILALTLLVVRSSESWVHYERV